MLWELTSRRRVFPELFQVLLNFHECFYNSIEKRSTCFPFLLANTATRKKKTTCQLRLSKCKILFARAITTSTARASCVSPPSYTNTIFNQSARVLSQDCFLNVFTFQDTFLILNRDVKLSALSLGLFISFWFANEDVKDVNYFPFRPNYLEIVKKDFIDKLLVNLVKYHYLSLRLLQSLFKKFENKFKNNHEVQKSCRRFKRVRLTLLLSC